MKCPLGISDFLEEVSSLSHSIVFLCFFALLTEEGFLNSPCYSLELCIQMDISFLSPLPFASLLFSAICKASSDNHFAFLHFFFLGMTLIPVSCTVLQTSSIILQALYQIWSLESISHFHCIIVRDLISVIPEWSSGFPYFKSKFCNKEFIIWATVSSQSCLCWLYRASTSLAAKSITWFLRLWLQGI